MKYIVCKRLKKDTLQGPTNLKYGTECESQGNFIFYNNKPLCVISSEDAYTYLSRNDDGNGLTRFKLIQDIKGLLMRPGQGNNTPSRNPSITKDIYDKRWKTIWSDEKVQKFKRPEHKDYWVWNFDFYNAELEELAYIISIISKTS